MAISHDAVVPIYLFFFFNDTATTEIYTLSLHDALPISCGLVTKRFQIAGRHLGLSRIERTGECLTEKEEITLVLVAHISDVHRDRKSTRLNSSHANISYAVFCLKKKTN